MVSYDWTFPQCFVAVSQDGLSQVVTSVYWRLTATDGEFSASAMGIAALDPVSDPSGFIEFSALTKDQVASWVETKLNTERHLLIEGDHDVPAVDRMKANLAADIYAQRNPPIVPQHFEFGN